MLRHGPRIPAETKEERRGETCLFSICETQESLGGKKKKKKKKWGVADRKDQQRGKAFQEGDPSFWSVFLSSRKRQ